MRGPRDDQVLVDHRLDQRRRAVVLLGQIAQLLGEQAAGFFRGVAKGRILADHDHAGVADPRPWQHHDSGGGQRQNRRPADRFALDVGDRFNLLRLFDHADQLERGAEVTAGTVDIQDDDVHAALDRLFETAFQQRTAERVDVLVQLDDHGAALRSGRRLDLVSILGRCRGAHHRCQRTP